MLEQKKIQQMMTIQTKQPQPKGPQNKYFKIFLICNFQKYIFLILIDAINQMGIICTDNPLWFEPLDFLRFEANVIIVGFQTGNDEKRKKLRIRERKST